MATVFVTKPFIHAGLIRRDKETVKFWMLYQRLTTNSVCLVKKTVKFLFVAAGVTRLWLFLSEILNCPALRALVTWLFNFRWAVQVRAPGPLGTVTCHSSPVTHLQVSRVPLKTRPKNFGPFLVAKRSDFGCSIKHLRKLAKIDGLFSKHARRRPSSKLNARAPFLCRPGVACAPLKNGSAQLSLCFLRGVA